MAAAPDHEDGALAQAARWGAPAATIAAMRGVLGDGGDPEGVWPENVSTLDAFLAAASQWRTVAVGGGMAPAHIMVLGLDYAGARAGIEAAGIAITPRLWAGLRVMEAEAVRALNDRTEAAAR